MKTFALLVILVAVLSCVSTTEVQNCASGLPPRSVTIAGCDKPPCRLLKGKDVTVEVAFSTNKSTTSLKPKVLTRFSGLSIPYDLPKEQKNGCAHLTDSRCPLEAHEDVTYMLTMPIRKMYPSIKIEIQLEMFSEENESQFCFKLDCEVVGG